MYEASLHSVKGTLHTGLSSQLLGSSTTNTNHIHIPVMDSVKPHSTSTWHVVAMPYPGRGHVNPMMNLCKLLSSKKPDIVFTFVVTEEWLGFIDSSDTSKPANIQFGTIPNCIPSEIGRAKDFPGFVKAVATKMEAPFEQLLDRLELPVSVIIADTYLDWVVNVGNRRNIAVASLWPMSATVFSILHHFELIVQNGHFPAELSEQGEERVDYVPGVPSTRLMDLPMFHGTDRQVMHRALESVSLASKAQYILFTSVYELESQVIDALKPKFHFPLYPVGPTIPYFELKDSSSVISSNHSLSSYIEWLDSQPKGSVLYISMGSFLSVSSAQLDEIVAGVHSSSVRFLWVSPVDAGPVKDGSGDMGLVVPWCDQLRVLCHPAVGGFWTHCGQNSTIEAVFAGVPMLTSPIFWDQIPNSKKIVEEWEIGWRVKRDLGRETLVTREEIAKLVQRFMDAENIEVKEMRIRARELREACLAAIVKGGSSDTNLDSFIRDISQGQTN